MFQAATSINEQTLTFVPKLIVVAICLAIVRRLDHDADRRLHQDMFARDPRDGAMIPHGVRGRREPALAVDGRDDPPRRRLPRRPDLRRRLRAGPAPPGRRARDRHSRRSSATRFVLPPDGPRLVRRLHAGRRRGAWPASRSASPCRSASPRRSVAGEVIGNAMGLGFAAHGRSDERPAESGARPVPLDPRHLPLPRAWTAISRSPRSSSKAIARCRPAMPGSAPRHPRPRPVRRRAVLRRPLDRAAGRASRSSSSRS